MFAYPSGWIASTAMTRLSRSNCKFHQMRQITESAYPDASFSSPDTTTHSSIPFGREMSQTAAHDASPPFSGQDANLAATDLILRSSDRVDFHTHKIMLAFVSPVFQDMLTFPTPPVVGSEDIKDGKPVVQLSEPSAALHKLLLMCYPQEVFADLDGVCQAYHAADKYQIPGARDAILRILPTFMQAEPYRMYAIACHLGLPKLAASAAGETLNDFFLPHQVVAPEFDLIPASTLLSLHKLHSECGNKAAELIDKFTLSLPAQPGVTFGPVLPDAPWWTSQGHGNMCGALLDGYGRMISPAQWFLDHLANVAEVVRYTPSGERTAKSMLEFDVTLHKISKCEVCSREAAGYLTELRITKFW
ncbi:hypothetical protein K438DRAFT_140252 [Mycena galopus ATCC 62051]|nr:hypothetical protein K438DRAFT_140252 [Mycena galopus ATCC 62051]